MNICKTCKTELKNKKRIYCSNKCKFSDVEYNKSRIPSIKNDYKKRLICRHCGWETSDFNNLSGQVKIHLKQHDIIFDKNTYLTEFNVVDLSEDSFWKCHLCDWKTTDVNNKSGCILTHLMKVHDLSHEDILTIKSLNVDNSKQLKKLKEKQFLYEDEKNRIKCEICGECFKKLSNSHLKKHNISPTEYKRKYGIYNTASKYISEIQSELTFKHNINKTNTSFNRSSGLETEFAKSLKDVGIRYVNPFVYMGKSFDFFLIDLNIVIEIDGESFHKDSLQHLTIQTINGSVNDNVKNKIMKGSSFKFYRIRYDKNKFVFNASAELVKLLETFKYTPDYSLSYRQKISDKEYFERYIEFKGKDELREYSSLFLKFIRQFQPEFPTVELEETFVGVTDTISKYDLDSCYCDENKKSFSNNISSIGNNYLKHYFKSYWKSKFNGQKSPIEAWFDDKVMQKVINYRIGINESGEVFDFSLYQLLKGLSASRVTVSFFKPLLAAAIYKHYIGNMDNPTVLDPCCGFGGRLLGFKSVYPQGTYIGCEPNAETFNELTEMVNREHINNVNIYNCKFENFVDKQLKYDFIFTSIPYFESEIYSNNVAYESFNLWKDTFISSIERLGGRNCYINTSSQLCEKLGWTTIDASIISNTSHFNKGHNKKSEMIVKL